MQDTNREEILVFEGELVMEPRASHMLDKCSTTESHHQPLTLVFNKKINKIKINLHNGVTVLSEEAQQVIRYVLGTQQGREEHSTN